VTLAAAAEGSCILKHSLHEVNSGRGEQGNSNGKSALLCPYQSEVVPLQQGSRLLRMMAANTAPLVQGQAKLKSKQS
jgi:hypothetical protein